MIRAAIVGLWKMGLSHQSMVNMHPEIQLKSVCDSSGYMLDVLSKYTGIDTYSGSRKMFDRGDLDCVFVATPSRYHADIVTDALERGMHQVSPDRVDSVWRIQPPQHRADQAADRPIDAPLEAVRPETARAGGYRKVRLLNVDVDDITMDELVENFR